MFGIRIVCIECAIFTSYRKQEYDSSLGYGKTTSIDPLVPEEYRLVAVIGVNGTNYYRVEVEVCRFF